MPVQARVALVYAIAGLAASGQSLPNLFAFPNAEGLETYNAGNRPIDTGFLCVGSGRAIDHRKLTCR